MAKRPMRLQLTGGKGWVLDPPSHLPSKSVHAGRKQRIKELKAANNNQEEKPQTAIAESLERIIWKRY